MSSVIHRALKSIVEELHPIVPCVPGGYNMPIVSGAHDAGFRVLLATSEAGAAHLAMGLAWESRRVALCLTITSPGVYGTIQALHAAAVNRVPLVLVSGEVAFAGAVQAGDGVGGPSVTHVTAPLCAWSAFVARPADVAGALFRAVRTAGNLRRPVHLNIALDACADVTT